MATVSYLVEAANGNEIYSADALGYITDVSEYILQKPGQI